MLVLSTLTTFAACRAKEPTAADLSGDTIRFLGRVQQTTTGLARLTWGGSTILGRFEGSQIIVQLQNNDDNINYFDVLMDDSEPQLLTVVAKESTYNIKVADGTHTFALVKRNEDLYGSVTFKGLTTDGTMLNTEKAPHFIEFVGDSISNGYGIEGRPQGGDGPVTTDCKADAKNENARLAFPMLTAATLGVDYSVVAASGRGVVRNNDQTTVDLVPQLWLRPAPRDQDLPYDFAVKPDLVVVNLGTNDFTQSFQGSLTNPPANFVAGYTNFLKQIRSKYPETEIIACLGPMLSSNLKFANGAEQLATARSQVQQAIAQAADAKIKFLEFATQTTNANNLACEYHPNTSTQQAMAAQLSKFIQDSYGW